MQVGQLAVVETLVSGGARAGATDKYGDTAGQLAEDFGHPRAAEYLAEVEAREE